MPARKNKRTCLLQSGSIVLVKFDNRQMKTCGKLAAPTNLLRGMRAENEGKTCGKSGKPTLSLPPVVSPLTIEHPGAHGRLRRHDLLENHVC